ncbi:MAG: HAD-IIA family hydrolase [Erysipelotrichaceae bacterium]
MKTYLIDLDGTMYRGNDNIEGASDFIEDLFNKNIPYLFLTNNATRTAKQNVEHMLNLGFKHIKEDDFFTSSMAAAKYIAKLNGGMNAYVIGEDGLKEALVKEHYTITNNTSITSDYVFVGLDSNATYIDYSKALQELLKGSLLVATNNDRRLPKGDSFAIGNGAIVDMFEYASEQTSIKIGKPYSPILDEALNYLNLTKDDVILIGDNLETDIALGYNNGVKTIFVTSGVHNESDIEKFKIYPDITVAALKNINNA